MQEVKSEKKEEGGRLSITSSEEAPPKSPKLGKTSGNFKREQVGSSGKEVRII
jgi:hypothetical protein